MGKGMIDVEYTKRLDTYFETFEPQTDAIVVGTSPSLKSYEFGKYIDKFNTVIRVNRCFFDGMYQHTGEKIDIWSTTNNYRWDHFHPIKSEELRIWPRKRTVAEKLHSNGTLDGFDNVTMNVGTWEFLKNEYGRSKFNQKYNVVGKRRFVGVGTGLITLDRAIREFSKITIIGHTFYLEGGTDNRALNFYSEEEDAEHTRNRKDYFKGDKHRLRQMSYVKEWMRQGKITLLNPFEYDNLRTGK